MQVIQPMPEATQVLVKAWVGAVIILSIYSFLYNDNKLYRMVLNACIGITFGYGLIITWKQVLGPLWWDVMWGNMAQIKHGGVIACIGAYPLPFLYWLFLGIIGSFWYFQSSRRYLWLARIPIGIMLGANAGIIFKQQLLQNRDQIIDSARPLLATGVNGTWPSGQPWMGSGMHIDIWQSVSNLIFVVGIAAVMVYFFFSFDHTNPTVKRTAGLGRWLLMLCFGGFFGNTIMTRMAVLLQNIEFMNNEWAPAPIAFGHRFSVASGWVGLGLLVVGGLIYTIWYLLRKPTKPSGPDTPQTEEELGAAVTR